MSAWLIRPLREKMKRHRMLTAIEATEDRWQIERRAEEIDAAQLEVQDLRDEQRGSEPSSTVSATNISVTPSDFGTASVVNIRDSSRRRCTGGSIRSYCVNDSANDITNGEQLEQRDATTNGSTHTSSPGGGSHTWRTPVRSRLVRKRPPWSACARLARQCTGAAGRSPLLPRCSFLFQSLAASVFCRFRYDAGQCIMLIGMSDI